MIHADVFEFEIDSDAVVGEKRWKFNELISEVFYELIVDVGDPGFHLDRDVLEEEVDALIFFQDWLHLDHVLVLQAS